MTPEFTLSIADDLMKKILYLSRQLNPEEWDNAKWEAYRRGWSTGDCALMADVRLLSMRATPNRSRYKPERQVNGNA